MIMYQALKKNFGDSCVTAVLDTDNDTLGMDYANQLAVVNLMPGLGAYYSTAVIAASVCLP
ncbi:hypothetical protein Ct61P_15505 [Colletotrichum tofieldiae]|nr:hypothetical protein Ct61P_15505 [Colletotrichum tofieldiae]